MIEEKTRPSWDTRTEEQVIEFRRSQEPPPPPIPASKASWWLRPKPSLIAAGITILTSPLWFCSIPAVPPQRGEPEPTTRLGDTLRVHRDYPGFPGLWMRVDDKPFDAGFNNVNIAGGTKHIEWWGSADAGFSNITIGNRYITTGSQMTYYLNGKEYVLTPRGETLHWEIRKR